MRGHFVSALLYRLFAVYPLRPGAAARRPPCSIAVTPPTSPSASARTCPPQRTEAGAASPASPAPGERGSPSSAASASAAAAGGERAAALGRGRRCRRSRGPGGATLLEIASPSLSSAATAPAPPDAAPPRIAACVARVEVATGPSRRPLPGRDTAVSRSTTSRAPRRQLRHTRPARLTCASAQAGFGTR